MRTKENTQMTRMTLHSISSKRKERTALLHQIVHHAVGHVTSAAFVHFAHPLLRLVQISLVVTVVRLGNDRQLLRCGRGRGQGGAGRSRWGDQGVGVLGSRGIRAVLEGHLLLLLAHWLFVRHALVWMWGNIVCTSRALWLVGSLVGDVGLGLNRPSRARAIRSSVLAGGILVFEMPTLVSEHVTDEGRTRHSSKRIEAAPSTFERRIEDTLRFSCLFLPLKHAYSITCSADAFP